MHFFVFLKDKIPTILMSHIVTCDFWALQTGLQNNVRYFRFQIAADIAIFADLKQTSCR